MNREAIKLPKDVKALFVQCHQAAVDGGWWHDLQTGERLSRNKGELLCLIHSEISEGYDADLYDLADDKLPHRLGAEVELADAMIRLADYAGGFGHKLSIGAIQTAEFADLSWAELHSRVSRVMEQERKGRIAGAEIEINDLAAGIAQYAQIREFDLWGAMREKLEFNAQRADHKPENRRLSDGKAW